MLQALTALYRKLISKNNLKPNWLSDCTPDKNHFHRRRFTAKYKSKQRIVRGIWLSFAVVALCFQALQIFFALGLLTTFISFCILDETE